MTRCPVYAPPREGPEGSPGSYRGFPLVFDSGARNKAFFCSQHHNVPRLARQRPHPLVSINPRDALSRGIQDGDNVEVVTPRGRARFKAQVTEDIAAGRVEADANGGGPLGPAAWRDCNVNELTDA